MSSFFARFAFTISSSTSIGTRPLSNTGRPWPGSASGVAAGSSASEVSASRGPAPASALTRAIGQSAAITERAMVSTIAGV